MSIPRVGDTPKRPPAATSAPAEMILKGFLRHACGLDVRNEDLVPDPPYLICANHRSHADSIVLMSALRLSFRECGLLAAYDYFFQHPWRYRLFSPFFILIPFERDRRQSSFRATLASCRYFLNADSRVLVAYPEGGRCRTEALQPFRRGPATLALALNVPILPAFITGTDRLMPKGTRLLLPTRVSVRFGAPLLPSDFAQYRPLAVQSRAMTAALFAAVARLAECNELQGELQDPSMEFVEPSMKRSLQ